MRVLVVYNHPYQGSFCHAILSSVTQGLTRGGHQVDLINLDKDGFDPVLREKDLKAFITASKDLNAAYSLLDEQVLDYKSRLEQAEHLVFIFPIWWELMPALTKGFIDKVIFPGIAYDYISSGNGMVSRLPGLKGVTMITTMNTPSIAYRLLFGNAIKKALLMGTFWKIGIKNRHWMNLAMVKFSKESKRLKWLNNLEDKFKNLK
ncbi:NAD(P)H-dependent oxidoreductase [Ferrimonas sp. YFM]|uniref:NAD(P)H-dependent oxidoreductase n=1 Tax=Ferrimonas sp. YFM TaxID=3028878 RepID=UPI002572C4C5|nr:NAD(P)H-dependent oxidoreductase [Ferrimonas sp. YFM]BDY04451.1 NAD(P)H dehydrogenase [Ferrimonas sp. YFM]